MWFYVGGDDYGGEDVDSTGDIPEIFVESGIEVSIVEIKDTHDEEECDSGPSKPLQAIEPPNSTCFV